MNADNWVGAIVFGVAGVVALIAGGAILAARWPDVVAWWRALRSDDGSAAYVAGLRDRIAVLMADNARLRSQRDASHREAQRLRERLEDDDRNSITVIQIPPSHRRA